MLLLHYIVVVVVDANLLELVRELDDLIVCTSFRKKHHHLGRSVWLNIFSIRRTSMWLVYRNRVMLSLRMEEMVRWLWSWLKRMRQVANWCFRAVIVKVALAPWIEILLYVLLYINQLVRRARIHLLLGRLLLSLRHIKLHPFVANLLRLHCLRSRW